LARGGVDDLDSVAKLARHIKLSKEFHFGGLHAYQGSLMHTVSYEDRVQGVEKVDALLLQVIAVLEKEGLHPDIVTGGGTGTFEFDGRGGVCNEVQPGSFILGDIDYGRNKDAQGRAWRDIDMWKQSLYLVSQVIRRQLEGENPRLLVDVGVKWMALEEGHPPVPVDVPCLEKFVIGGDEHGIVQLSKAALASDENRKKVPQLGDRIRFISYTCDPQIALFERVYAVEDGKIVAIWPLCPRGA
jgi:3-hydroxy-D-aspartate aldolase